MGVINVLDKQTANLIAAGEVVERPSSAIKEMLENCADAGATKITAEIKNGGTTYIRITDNGKGMLREDVPKCILRHATSKIKTGTDLESIATFGFRGEALAAISSVSEMRILTKSENEEMGTLFECRYGEQTKLEDAGCPNGTTIIVNDIFGNVPARRKFLKKDSTEAISVSNICEKFIMSRPEISLTLISDGNVKLESPGNGDLKSAIYSVLGREFANALIPVDYTYSSVRVYGFIVKPEMCRPNRNMQNFFVNNRYVRSRTMLAALEEGYRAFCPAGKFPACVLFCDIDYSLVDVNVHPAKLEIKFSDERRIFDCTYFAVKNALSSTNSFNVNQKINEIIAENDKETIIINVDKNVDVENKQNIVQESSQSQVQKEADNFPVKNSSFVTTTKNEADKLFVLDFIRKQNEKNNISVENKESTKLNVEKPNLVITNETHVFQTDVEKTKHNQNAKVEVIEEQTQLDTNKIEKIDFKPVLVGEVFDTYLLVQLKQSMYIIDKHAAHERIIYEKLKKPNVENSSQYLLEPISVSLVPKEAEAANEHSKYLIDIGFEFEDFGINSFLIRAIPTPIAQSDAKDIFTFLAGKLSEGNTRSAGEIFDKALYTAACRAAIKAGDKHTYYDNMYIINEIFTNDAVLYCPHGRPVITEFSREKLNKMFSRP